MEWIESVIMTGVLVRAIYTDVRRDRIENRLIVTGMVSGLVCAGIRGGPAECLQCLKMAAVMLAILFLLFVLHGLGAGDIKLLCVAAVFFPKQAMMILMTAFLFGGVLAVGRILVGWVRREKTSLRKETIHFSIPIALGTWITIFMIYSNRIQ